MDNRTLLAIILSVVVIIGYQFLFTPQQPAVLPQKPVAGPVEKSAEKNEGTEKIPAVQVSGATVSGEEKEIRVETGLYHAVLSSQGGTIKYWEIKPYKDKIGKAVILLSKAGTLPAMAVGSNMEFEFARANFSVSGGNLNLDKNTRTGSVVFEYSGEGKTIRRTYTFYADTYKVDLTDEVSGLANYWISLGSDFGIFQPDESAHFGPILLQGTDIVELNPKNLDGGKTYGDNLKWIAQEDKYFFAGLVPLTQVEEAKAWPFQGSPVIAIKAKPGVNKFNLYAGPKEHEQLAPLNIGLEHIINFGFFSIIARPLFWILKFLYGFLGNYGWAIIVLTVIVRIPFIPIVNKGQASMKKLQDIQPKMNEIKEKYKKDPQRMQAEMMELYKKNRVNPMGGCLPMLLQIPVFFALYKVLLISIELRGAPFMLWISDLSAPDALFGHVAGFSLGGPLPYLMGITMVIQQKMTPTTMDPKQAKIMMLMPVIFTFMFLNFASGLVLYWLVNNVLSIVQQYFVNKKLAQQQPA